MRPPIKRLTLAALLGLWPHLGKAQTFDLIDARLYEPLLGSQTLHNARAVALGGAYSGLVKDASALWYNPANLGRLEHTELQAEITHARIEGESWPLTGTPLAPPPTVDPTRESLSRTRLSAAYLAVPLKGPSSDWTVGFGMAITHDLDRALAGNLRFASGDFVSEIYADTVDILDYDFTDDQRGVVRAWQFGVGGRVSRSVMIGATGVYYDGYLEFTNRATFTGTLLNPSSPGTPVRYDLTTSNRESMRGWGLNGGVYITPGRNFAVSATARSPVTFKIDLDQTFNDLRDLVPLAPFSEATTRDLKLPFTASAGAAVRLGPFRVAGDFGFTDWSQSEYKNSSLIQYNDSLRITYQQEYAWAGGAEFSPDRGTFSARGGIRYVSLPYHDNLTVDHRLTYSAGIGFVLDRAMLLDVAVSQEKYRGGNPLFGFDEAYVHTKVLVTTAYRFP